jgi:deoxycytidylate deaminase
MKIFKTTKKLSEKSDHHTHKFGAVIAFKNIIISHGWNKLKTHPKSTHPWKHIHAEMDAIFKAKGNTVGATLYVTRVSTQGNLNNSKPCPFCMSLIVAAGIKKVFYTDNNEWKEINV